MSDVDLVIKASQKFEKWLKERLGAQGKGLIEQTRSVESMLPTGLVRGLVYVGRVRNEVVHKEPEIKSRDQFNSRVAEVELDLGRLGSMLEARGSSNSPPPTEFSFVIVNRYSDKCLEVADGSKDDGGRVQQWTFHGGLNQLWRLCPCDDKHFRIVSKYSQKCLDVPGATQDDGAFVQQWSASTWNEGVNQQWLLEPAGETTFFVRAKHSDKCLDVDWAGRDDGARITQWPWHGGENQRWSFRLAGE